MILKIKLEDKAAFLNRLEKQDVPVDSSKIKDNKLEGYFEIDIIDPKQLEIVKTILKQSPKINTIKEMKQSLTRSQLKEMVRKELQGVVAKKKKMNEEEDKEETIKITLDEYVGDDLSYRAGKWVIENIPAIADVLKGTPKENGQEIVDLGNMMISLVTVGSGALVTGLAMYKDDIVNLAKKLKNAIKGGVKEGDDEELAQLAADIQAQA